MEEMKKDEALEEQQTTAEAAEATEAEAVQAEEIPDAVDETAEKIAKLEQQAADNLDKYQRTLAEFDNFRKRTIKEKAVMYDDGVRSTIEKLLTVIDNLERAVADTGRKGRCGRSFLQGRENDSGAVPGNPAQYGRGGNQGTGREIRPQPARGSCA